MQYSVWLDLVSHTLRVYFSCFRLSAPKMKIWSEIVIKQSSIFTCTVILSNRQKFEKFLHLTYLAKVYRNSNSSWHILMWSGRDDVIAAWECWLNIKVWCSSTSPDGLLNPQGPPGKDVHRPQKCFCSQDETISISLLGIKVQNVKVLGRLHIGNYFIFFRRKLVLVGEAPVPTVVTIGGCPWSILLFDLDIYDPNLDDLGPSNKLRWNTSM